MSCSLSSASLQRWMSDSHWLSTARLCFWYSVLRPCLGAGRGVERRREWIGERAEEREVSTRGLGGGGGRGGERGKRDTDKS